MVCKGICSRYKAKWVAYMPRYAFGQKLCNTCDIFIFWDGLSCPCCNYKLRLSPRKGKYKKKFLEIKSVKKRQVLVNSM